MKQSFTRGLVAAALAIGLSAGVADTAMAGGKKGHGGRGVPTQQINVQLWTFAEYIGFGTDAATIQRTEEVFGEAALVRLQERRAVHAQRPDRRSSTATSCASTA